MFLFLLSPILVVLTTSEIVMRTIKEFFTCKPGWLNHEGMWRLLQAARYVGGLLIGVVLMIESSDIAGGMVVGIGSFFVIHFIGWLIAWVVQGFKVKA